MNLQTIICLVLLYLYTLALLGLMIKLNKIEEKINKIPTITEKENSDVKENN